MQTSTDLKNLLNRIDHKSYPAYKETKGIYQFPGYKLSIDHVQGDPFAAPSKVSIHIKNEIAGFPVEYFQSDYRRVALQDYLTRLFGQALGRYTFKARGSGKSGMIAVSSCTQEVLERTACTMDASGKEMALRLEVGFPANGRTINARELIKILFDFLPESVNRTLRYKNCDMKEIQNTIFLADDQQYIRAQLPKLGLIAFVGDGAILPRESGICSKPMKAAVLFSAPEKLRIVLDLPHKGKVSGMGIKKGITLIVGGGYHGKSTLLKALELGVYNHIAGDGREYVITDSTAMKIRAEDGRSIKKTDISMFIKDLPNKKDTRMFTTEDASGSTSQAANVIEGLEAGAKVLLIDEDTSATNFMIRDELMQRVIHREMEPITPFIERIQELDEDYETSTVIVAGSSGAYFHIADCIIQMDNYMPKDITVFAKKEAEVFPMLSRPIEKSDKPLFSRCPQGNRSFQGDDRIKMKTLGKESVQINREIIDLRYVEQIVDSEQLTALGYCIKYAEKHLLNSGKTLQEIVEELNNMVQKDGLASLCENYGVAACIALPRKQEIHACFNRYRGLRF
jgi:predicted ABC-class ATPase